MSSLSKREKTLLIILGAAIVFYLYYSFFFKPVMARANTVKESVKRYEVQVNRIKNAKTIIEKQKSDLEKLKLQLIEVLKTIPDRERNPEISFNLKNLAAANSLSINSMNFGQVTEFKPESQKPQEEKKDEAKQGEDKKTDKPQEDKKTPQGDSLSIVPVVVNISGEYPQIMNFIAALEGDKRIASVGGVTITKGQDGKLTASITATFYFSGTVIQSQEVYDFNEGRTDGKANLFK